jgi:murein DD-endopeptidase MepM/ murein hydrolase activator NlpD
MKTPQIISGFVMTVVSLLLIFSTTASAITQDQLNSIINNTPFYDPSSSPCASSTQTAGSTNIVSGSSVYILGDSITQRAVNAYQSSFQKLGITTEINYQTGRSLTTVAANSNASTGMQAIAANTSEIKSASAIVIDLGVSGTAPLASVDGAISAIRAANPNAPIYWVDGIVINNPSLVSQVQQSNQAIYKQASQENYTIISWFKTVDPNGDPTNLTGQETDTNGYIDQSDGLGINPSVPNGVNALVNLVIGALNGNESGSSNQGAVCCDVGGGSQVLSVTGFQKQNAQTIIGIAKTDGLSENAALIGLMVGLDESHLTNDANENIPLSELNPNKEGDGNNATSLGVFQQQLDSNWSTFSSNLNDVQAINQLMTPSYAAEAFFGSPPGTNTSSALQKGLQNVSNWESMDPWLAAQAVQGSGDSSGLNYKAYMSDAQSLLNQYWSSSTAVPLPVSFQAAASNSGNSAYACNGSVTPLSASGYANPLRSVSALNGERVDQGVDFSGSGPVYAVGNGTIENTHNAGWPQGNFITYVLNSGPAKGFEVYVAEDCTPTVSVGQAVTPNTVICTMFEGSSGIEIGWAASNNGTSEAFVLGQAALGSSQGDAGKYSTGMGVNFLQLLQSTGLTLSSGSNTINQPIQNQNMPSNFPTW